MCRKTFCLQPLEGFSRSLSSNTSSVLIVLMYLPTDPNSCLLTDSQRARSCDCQGALGGAGQPWQGQVRCDSNGTWSGMHIKPQGDTYMKLEMSNGSRRVHFCPSVWRHDAHAHWVPRPLQWPFPAGLQRPCVLWPSASQTVSTSKLNQNTFFVCVCPVLYETKKCFLFFPNNTFLVTFSLSQVLTVYLLLTHF